MDQVIYIQNATIAGLIIEIEITIANLIDSTVPQHHAQTIN